ncbi:hypothetical protein [Streptomyces sp. cg2]
MSQPVTFVPGSSWAWIDKGWDDPIGLFTDLLQTKFSHPRRI